MAESVMISLGVTSKNLDAELQKTKNKFDKLNQSILDDKAKNNINAMKQSLGGLGKMGDSLGGTFEKIAGGFSSLLSPVGLLTAGIGLAITAGVNLYKKLTLSHEQYLAYLDHQMQKSQQKMEKINKQQSTDNGYFDRLKQLNDIENLSNASKTQAIMLIQVLTSKYGDLGLSIDETTGKIIGLDNAIKKVNERMENLKIKQQKNIANIAMQKADEIASNKEFNNFWKSDTKLEDTFRSNEQKSNMRNAGYGTETANEIGRKGVQRMRTFNLQNGYVGAQAEQKQFAEIGKQFAEINDRAKNENRQLTESEKTELNALKQRQNALKNILELSTKISVAEQMIGLVKQDQDATAYWKNVLSALDDAKNKWEKLYLLQEQSGNGQIGRLNRIKELTLQQGKVEAKNLESARELIRIYDEQEKLKKQYELNKKDKSEKLGYFENEIASNQNKKDNLILQNNETINQLQPLLDAKNKLQEKQKNGKLTDDEFNELLELYKLINPLQEKYQKEQVKIADIDKKILELEIKRNEIKDELNKIFKQGNEILDNELKLQQMIAQNDIREIERQKIIQQLKAKGLDPEKLKKQGINIDNQIDSYVDKKMELDKQKFMQEQTQNIDRQITLESMKLQGLFDEIELQKLLNQLQDKKIQLDKKQIDAIMAKKKQLQTVQFSNLIKDQTDGLLQSVQSQINKKQAQADKRIKEYQKKYGKLNQDQKDAVKSIVDMEFEIAKVQNEKVDFSHNEIKTNSLTQRGGFSGGVVMSRMETINEKISANATKQVQLLTNIKTLIQDLKNAGII